MKPSSVSVILPTFNRLQYLRPAVRSVFAQTFHDWHLIIADDGSEAETTAYLARLAHLPHVTLIRLSHTGNPSVVRNAALREARGEYVAFLDSDDIWLPTKLEVQVAVQKASGARRWSYSAENLIDANGRLISGDGAHGRVLPDGAIFEQLLTLEAAVSTPCVLAERHLIEDVGGFDESQPYFEDYDLWLRLSLRSEVAAINEPLVLVRNHAEHYSADRVGVYHARFRLLEKMAGMAASSRHHAILRIERAKTAAALASVHAGLGHRADALKLLWRSRECAWRGHGWWSKAGTTFSRAIAPSWLRAAVRRCRGTRLKPTPAGR
jgi:hypothetical protein